MIFAFCDPVRELHIWPFEEIWTGWRARYHDK